MNVGILVKNRNFGQTLRYAILNAEKVTNLEDQVWGEFYQKRIGIK